MYGMVNQALEALVRDKFGDGVWESVKLKAGVHEVAFVTMHEYSDEVTYKLAGALSDETGVPVPELLHAFGIYWVSFADRGPWGKLMRESGQSTYELMAALDAMHARIAMSFPALKPPSFRVRPATAGTGEPSGAMLLEYRSHRPGLAPFVVGLLEGMGQLYQERVEVKQVAAKGEAGAECDVFLVRTTANGSGAGA
ncbi:MAG: heme NO-binding domain-containing protein [Planctomycetota bacterium]|nr:heme NO-binding domain-containing protein [Planctomycetota bacterium]